MFSLGVNNCGVFTLKELFAKFFFSKHVIWKKKAPYQSSNLWNIIREMWYTFHIIFSIFFKFTIPKEHFCDVCSFSFSLLLLKMFFKCSINVNQQSKDETLICAIWRCKGAVYTPSWRYLCVYLFRIWCLAFSLSFHCIHPVSVPLIDWF